MTGRIPRVTTRGSYDLLTGKRLRRDGYRLYPKGRFAGMAGTDEIAVMVHGLGNNSRGAISKVVIAQERLGHLGYGHPVVGFSYDSNTTGAHLASRERRALAAGQRIARYNGTHLGRFVMDFKAGSPDTKVRLIGHSLGAQVILGALEYLSERSGTVQSIHLFGASIPADTPTARSCGNMMRGVVRGEMVNHYAPSDEVLAHADRTGLVRCPLGLHGTKGRPVSGFQDRMVEPENHRFASYAQTLGSFP